MSFPKSLQGLSPREEMVDALNRAVLGIDANDLDLFRSAFAQKHECSFVIRGQVTAGVDKMIEDVFNRVGPMDTTHIVSNFRIDYKDGADTASLTAHAIAQHGRGGWDGTAPRFMSGGIYFVDLVREDGEWKITTWKLDAKWVHGDQSVMQG